MTTQRNKETNQDGFASIVIALVLIIVMALLTLGFTQLANREQQSALDKQLAVQANYAAESGFNDVFDAYKKQYFDYTNQTTGSADPDHFNPQYCLTSDFLEKHVYNNHPYSGNIDGQRETGFKCVLMDLMPPYLTLTGVGPGSPESLYTKLPASPPSSLQSMTIQWTSADGHNTLAGGSEVFPPFDKWNPSASNPANDSPPVLEFSLTPLTPSFDRTYITNHTYMAYFYPSGGAADCAPSNTYRYCDYQYVTDTGGPSTVGNQVPVLHGGCSLTGDYQCSVTINNLPAGIDQYLIHVLPFYDTANIKITGVNTSNTPANFVGQATIDVTGYAKNVLKRIRVVAHPGVQGAPSEALMGDVCKRQQAAPTSTTWPQGTIFVTPNGNSAGGSDICNPVSP